MASPTMNLRLALQDPAPPELRARTFQVSTTFLASAAPQRHESLAIPVFAITRVPAR